MESELNMLCF